MIAAGLFAFGCNDPIPSPDPSPSPTDPEPEVKNIPIRLSTDISSKATDVSYEVGDQVGIYTVNYENGESSSLADSGNYLDNILFTYNGDEWTPEKEVYWKDQVTPADFYCYYPYQNSLSSASALRFTTQADQSSIENYKQSELLWGKATGVMPSSDPVRITTRHMLSNLIIYVKPGDGYTEESLAEEDITVTVTGLKTVAQLNISTGKVTAEGSPDNITPYRENDYWRALIVPQDVVGAELVQVTVGEDSYSLVQTVTFESNRQYKCTITINRIGGGVNIGIGGWDVDDTDLGGVVS